MQKEKARSRQRMKALEDELSRMRNVQDGLSRKIKASNEVSHQSTTVTVRLVAHKTNSMQLLKASGVIARQNIQHPCQLSCVSLTLVCCGFRAMRRRQLPGS